MIFFRKISMIFFREIWWSAIFGLIFLLKYGIQNKVLFNVGWIDVGVSLTYLLAKWHLKWKIVQIENREERREFDTGFHKIMSRVWIIWAMVYFIFFWSYLKEIQEESIGIIIFLSFSLFPKLALLTIIVIMIVAVLIMVCYRRRHPDDEHVRRRGLDFIGADTLIEVLANSPFMESNDSCAICLEKYQEGDQLRKMPCDHTFHRECIDHWLENRTTCPYCRGDLRSSHHEDLIHSQGVESIPV